MSESILASHRVTRNALLWTLLAQSIAIFPLFFYLPLWLPAVWLITSAWRIQIYRGHWTYPKTLVKSLLGAASIAGLMISYKGSFGVAPVVGFLVCAFLLKLLEAKSKKDVVIVLYVSFVAVGAQLLFNQTMGAALFALGSFIVLVAAFSAVFGLREVRPTKRVFIGAKLTLQALPLAVILFIVLPRVGQLWAVPINNSSAKTGFSESMAPGDFTELIRSNEIVFRASFTSLKDNEQAVPMPPPYLRYWRGLVLDSFDGRSWSRGKHRRISDYRPSKDTTPKKEEALQVGTIDYSYSIMLEPHRRHWLFTLMAPERLTDSTVEMGFKPQVLLATRLPVTQRIRYNINSAVNYQYSIQGLDADTQVRSLQLPESGNPRTRELVSGWVNSGLTGKQIVDKALSFYAESFFYTLKPPALGTDSIDEFLFITQRGFCEHFSSSFVYMMRLAKIPARVVVGYQGGELNDLENYLVVRQRDAHAWAEVWLEGSGWTRVDPTHAVAPNRIEMGIESGIDESEADSLPAGFSVGFLAKLQMRWDFVSYLWYSQVLAYDNESQKSIFEKWLGGTDYWRIALALFGGVGSLLFVYFFLPYLRGSSQEAKHLVLLGQFEKKLSKFGYTREKHESLEQFTCRVANANPDLKPQLSQLTKLFNDITYAGRSERLSPFSKVLLAFPYKRLRAL